MKKLGIGIQKFSEFKENSLIYVDKTESIYKLLTQGKYYFLSRPRRFGKSLLVDTIKEIYSGSKELFKNLWIHNKWDFSKTNPVIKISFAGMDYKNLGLSEVLSKAFDKIASDYNAEFKRATTFSEKFNELIELLGTDKKVVILIDEYDKPIIDFLNNEKMHIAEENREILKNLYSGIKDRDGFIELFFITGVSKFSQVSIFSDLNHLQDITTNQHYSTLTGYTIEEIESNYADYLNLAIRDSNLTEEQFYEKLKEWYNGYSWNAKNFVYNPFSVLNFLSNSDFDNYWFATGTPSFLLQQIRQNTQKFSDLTNLKVSKSTFNKFDIGNIDPVALMFQTGYLTMKEYEERRDRYLLDFPNKEVRDSFYKFALPYYTYQSQSASEIISYKMLDQLEANDIENFIVELKSLFAAIPQKESEHIRKYEGFYHSAVFIALKIMGMHIDCEVMTNQGIIDAVILTDNYIFVLEFKMGDAKTAMEQIEEKKYYEPYLADKRPVTLLGVGFDAKTRNVGSWEVKNIQNR